MIIASHRLGQARTSTTLDVYGRLLPSMQAGAAKLIDELVTPTEVKLNCPQYVS